MSTARSVAFHTLGCKLNFSETSSISKLFRDAGYIEHDYKEAADFYIINTCSVTDEADKKCRYAVRNSLRKNPNAKVIIIGCYAQLKPKEISEIPGVSMVLGAAEKFTILDQLSSLDPTSPHAVVKAGEIKEVSKFVPSYSIEDRTRTFLKVQDGCDYKCSFCTIPLARGKSRSGTIQEVLMLAEEIGKKGVHEIVLTGVNLGDFGNGTEVIEGSKPKKEALFVDLIKALDKQAAVPRYRISSIEPNLCTDEIIEFVAGSNCFVPHFHIPLQSGDNDLLASMKRRYKRELYQSRVEKIKSCMPHACIGVDIIVGYPGETETHFLNTYHFLKDLDVSYFHVFTYSERNNTLAAEMLNPVTPSLRNERNEKLRILSEKKRRSFYQSQCDSTQEVLWENELKDGKQSGYTKNYIKVYRPTELLEQSNKLETVRLPNELNKEGFFTV